MYPVYSVTSSGCAYSVSTSASTGYGVVWNNAHSGAVWNVCGNQTVYSSCQTVTFVVASGWYADPVREEYQRRQEARRAAEERAGVLLRRMLTGEQRRSLELHGSFEVVGSNTGRRYQVRYGTHGNIKLLNHDGRVVGSFCAQPDSVPTADAVLAQKLAIEFDEESFLRVANFREAA